MRRCRAWTERVRCRSVLNCGATRIARPAGGHSLPSWRPPAPAMLIRRELMKTVERLFAWMKRRQPAPRSRPEPTLGIVKRPAQAGIYAALSTYLENRFPNRGVLTFAEIED